MGRFYGRASLYGWFRTVQKSYNIIVLTSYGLALGAAVWFFIRRKRARLQDPSIKGEPIVRRLFPRNQDVTTTAEIKSQNKSPTKICVRMLASPSFCVTIFILVSLSKILGVEMTIHQNGLQSASSIQTLSLLGQLVPFIVSLGAFAEALCDSRLYLGTRRERKGIKEQYIERREELRPASSDFFHDASKLHTSYNEHSGIGIEIAS
ncbi:hypothetical protein F4811DRAFT_503408 [Daldinia bambusicola]|nr:hypothetical protein F4811DRAFT_503408 [Daldinia bambusicola]